MSLCTLWLALLRQAGANRPRQTGPRAAVEPAPPPVPPGHFSRGQTGLGPPCRRMAVFPWPAPVLWGGCSPRALRARRAPGASPVFFLRSFCPRPREFHLFLKTMPYKALLSWNANSPGHFPLFPTLCPTSGRLMAASEPLGRPPPTPQKGAPRPPKSAGFPPQAASLCENFNPSAPVSKTTAWPPPRVGSRATPSEWPPAFRAEMKHAGPGPHEHALPVGCPVQEVGTGNVLAQRRTMPVPPPDVFVARPHPLPRFERKLSRNRDSPRPERFGYPAGPQVFPPVQSK